MKKLLFIYATLFLTCNLSVKAQVSFPYFTGFDDASGQQDWQFYELGATKTYDWEFSTFGSFSAPECLTHFYPVGGTQLTVDWFVSPAFDFSIGGTIDSLRYAFSGFGTIAPNDTVALYLLQGSQNPDSATSKTLLFDFRDTIYKNDNVWRKLENVVIPTTSASAYLGFKYVTTNNWLDVRFDNLAVSGNGVNLKELQTQQSLVLYPNPSKGELRFKLTDENVALLSEIILKVYNMQGALVFEKSGQAEDIWDISELQGIYLYTVISSDSKVLITGKVIVNER